MCANDLNFKLDIFSSEINYNKKIYFNYSIQLIIALILNKKLNIKECRLPFRLMLLTI